ncbi:hypothetical protein [Paludisphaera sp.]|uniref:hypothetical protein n=1 Tax=Paludisphaera sp. TaxID=2017432 RepID=UPI00301D6725
MDGPTISRRDFEAQRARRFGASNPERMDLPFWLAMVHGLEEARLRRWERREPEGLGYYPTSVRRYFGDEDYSNGPIWNFVRMGSTRTPHPDGRLICVAGEHEDHYDPDFCIYNDVVVLDLDGSIQIFGYPRDVFPPTDFHTASLCGERLILIGSLGYPEERRPGVTPVFALHLDDYRVEPLPSHGDAPGWIWNHEAELSHGVVTIRGGEVWSSKGENDPRIWRNFDDFAYEVKTGRWTRLTRRPWRQYKIRDAGGKKFERGPCFPDCRPADDEPWKRDDEEAAGPPPDDPILDVSPDSLRPTSFRWELLSAWDEQPFDEVVRRGDRLLVEGVPTSINLDLFAIEIVIEGDMDEALADAIVRDIRENVEEEVGRPCLVEKYD